MKKVLYISLTVLFCSLLTSPSWAKGKPNKQNTTESHTTTVVPQTGSQASPDRGAGQQNPHSNRGGKVRGQERARQVQGNRTSGGATTGLNQVQTQQTTVQQQSTSTTQVQTTQH
jgi:hypothetical protein